MLEIAQHVQAFLHKHDRPPISLHEEMVWERGERGERRRGEKGKRKRREERGKIGEREGKKEILQSTR